MIYDRITVSETVHFEGLGLHSGEPVKVAVHPGNRGIGFRYKSKRVAAIPEMVSDTKRCTKLGDISTIEHLMSALAGLEITDAEIEVTAPELPALDGSSKVYVEALKSKTTKFAEGEMRDLFSRIFVQDGDIKIAIANGEGQWRYEFHTGERWPKTQIYEATNVIDAYANEIAPARTFGFAEEIPHLVQMGLARGLNLETALVIGENDYQNYALFPDEPARHKLLDVIGDLYLSGVPIRFLSVVAERSGHSSNVKAAQLLYQAIQGQRQA